MKLISNNKIVIISAALLAIAPIAIHKGWDAYYWTRLSLYLIHNSSPHQYVKYKWIETEKGSSGIESGYLNLENGSKIPYVFISHHLTYSHKSYSIFKGNKNWHFMVGWFCCNVSADDFKEKPKNESELVDFIHKNDNIDP